MKLLTVTKVLTSAALVLIVGGQVAAQSCTQVLNNANSDYQEGRLEFVNADDFQNCFTRSDGYADAERIQARKLVALAHIYEDRTVEAEEAMIQLLHDDPEHPYDEALDPHEFVYLYNKFRTKPIFRLGFRAGVSRSTYNLVDEFGVDLTGANDSIRGSFTPEIGIQAGVYIDYNFWNKAEVSLGVNFAQRNVSYSNNLYADDPLISDTEVTEQFYGPTSYTDNNTFIDIPLVVKYNVSISENFIVYPYAGVIGSLLLGASRDGTRIGGTAVNPGSIALDGVGLRETINYTYTAGIGFKIRNGVDFFTIEIGGGIGGNNFVNPDGRYQNNDLIYRLGQVDGNMGLDFLNAQVGYQKSFYNPKKLKEYRDK